MADELMERAAGSLSLGHAVRRRREAQSMTIEEAAEAADLDPRYIDSLEKGFRNPTYLDLCDLASALGVSAWELVRDAQTDDPRSGSLDSEPVPEDDGIG